MPDKFSWKLSALGFILFVYAVLSYELNAGSSAIALGNLTSYIPSSGVTIILLATGVALIIQQLILLMPKHTYWKKLDSAGTIMAASSYTLYLTHYPILRLLQYYGLNQIEQINPKTIGIFLLAVCICLIVSGLMYLLFEKHTHFVRNVLKKAIAS